VNQEPATVAFQDTGPADIADLFAILSSDAPANRKATALPGRASDGKTIGMDAFSIAGYAEPGQRTNEVKGMLDAW
jgi:hypothetical protein